MAGGRYSDGREGGGRGLVTGSGGSPSTAGGRGQPPEFCQVASSPSLPLTLSLAWQRHLLFSLWGPRHPVDPFNPALTSVTGPSPNLWFNRAACLPSPAAPLTETHLCHSFGVNLQAGKLSWVFSSSKLFTQSRGSPLGAALHTGTFGKVCRRPVVMIVCVSVRGGCHWHLAQWAKARGAAEHPTRQGQSPQRSYPGHKAHSAEKPAGWSHH